MKQLIYVSGIILAFSFPGIAIADDDTVDSQDFKYLVCSYIEDSASIEDAFSKIDTVAEELDLEDSQEEILDDLWEGDLMSENYCAGLEF